MDSITKINVIFKVMLQKPKIIPKFGNMVCRSDVGVPLPKRKLLYDKFLTMPVNEQMIFILKQLRFQVFGQHYFYNERLIGLLLKAIDIHYHKV
jgi:hypothetical protein